MIHGWRLDATGSGGLEIEAIHSISGEAVDEGQESRAWYAHCNVSCRQMKEDTCSIVRCPGGQGPGDRGAELAQLRILSSSSASLS
jgi:hypothetical protein